MSKVTPQETIRKALYGLLAQGEQGTEVKSPASTFMKLATQLLAQQVLEEARTDFLERAPYEPHTPAHPPGSRNGYKHTRGVESAEGMMPLAIPQVRDAGRSFRPPLLDWLKGHTDVLERLAVEMYARGLSTRDLEATLIDPETGRSMLSKSATTAVTDALWVEYETFRQRDLSGFPVVALFLDAVYESLRLQGGSAEGILVAWAILEDQRKVLLHIGLGNKESYQDWLAFGRDLVKRGCPVPLAITSDGAPGVIKAINALWPKSLRCRCWFHKMQNIVAKLPADAVEVVKAAIRTVRDAATAEEGERQAQVILRRYERLYPSAMACLADDLPASVNHLHFPLRLQKAIRTTNLLERAFEEERRRSKIIPRFFTEKSCLKLVYATLWRASVRWQRIRLTPKDLEALATLRQRLGLVRRSQNGGGPRIPPTPKSLASVHRRALTGVR